MSISTHTDPEAAIGQLVPLLQQGDFAAAEAFAAQARKEFPLDGELARLHGVALLQLQRRPEALTALERAAELANLELKPEETQSMLHDLNAILDHVARLNELDTSGVAPLAQVSELEGANGSRTLRPDTVTASLDRATVMAQAPETDGAFFKVPKVIER